MVADCGSVNRDVLPRSRTRNSIPSNPNTSHLFYLNFMPTVLLKTINQSLFFFFTTLTTDQCNHAGPYFPLALGLLIISCLHNIICPAYRNLNKLNICIYFHRFIRVPALFSQSVRFNEVLFPKS